MSRFSGLSKELQLAAVAAIALALSLLLPWYQKSYFQGGQVVQANVSALGVFSFVEAAVLLVALAVLFLVWARAQQKAFHLPGGDGVAITLAGAWAVLLLVWRLFDKPDIQGAGATIGIQWGIFGALLAAGFLIVAGARVRAAHAPEPPNPAADERRLGHGPEARALAGPPAARRDGRHRDAARPPRVGRRAARPLAREDDAARRRADDALARRSLSGGDVTARRGADHAAAARGQALGRRAAVVLRPFRGISELRR